MTIVRPMEHADSNSGLEIKTNTNEHEIQMIVAAAMPAVRSLARVRGAGGALSGLGGLAGGGGDPNRHEGEGTRRGDEPGGPGL